MRSLFVADEFADTENGPGSRHPGGAERTDDAVIDACPWPVDRSRIRALKESVLDHYDLIVIGNLHTATRAQCEAIARRGRHVLFEHDYRMCRYRGNHERALAHRLLDRCLCRVARFRGLFSSALGAVFLTHRQLARYEANPFLRLPPHEVLGCSVMGPDFFEAVRRQRESPVAKQGTVVVYSRWPFKGYAQALAYCEARGIQPTVVRDATPAELLAALARAERLVFLPEWHEPASRLAVEARFLGCEVISNERLGVAGEPWWSEPDAAGLALLENAPRRFWEIVSRLARIELPAANRDGAASEHEPRSH